MVVPARGPWDLSYALAAKTPPSWTRHGMPHLGQWLVRMAGSGRGRIAKHLDIGCGDGTKTVNYALAGLDVVGVDLSSAALTSARARAHGLAVSSRCTFLQADCTSLPLGDGSVASASDSLCFTHLDSSEQQRWKSEVTRVLAAGAYLLVVLFSDKDEHFHGHPVSASYSFDFDPTNPLMDGFEHYDGMYNCHFNAQSIEATFGHCFEVVEVVELAHPLYPHRCLWNVILRRPLFFPSRAPLPSDGLRNTPETPRPCGVVAPGTA